VTLAAYQDSPFFPAEVDLYTTDGIALLWDGVGLLDMACKAPRDLFQGHAEHRHEYVGTNPLPFWSGGFRYRAGLTTLAVYLDATDLGTSVTPRLRVYVEGVLRIDSAITSGVALYSVATMASWSLTDGQVCEVRMEIVDIGLLPAPNLGTGRAWGTYYLVDAFVGPLSSVSIGSWPGVPTFTDEPDPDKLLQLGNAADWLARRMALVPSPLFQRVVSSTDSRWWTPEAGEGETHLWSGGGIRGPFDRLVMKIVWVAGRATSTRIRLRINGSEVETTASITPGTWGTETFDVDLSGYSATDLLRVELDQDDTIGTNAPGGYPMRWSLEYAEFQRSDPGLQSLDFRPVPDELTTWTTRMNRLNALGAWLQVVKNTIDNDTDRWDRARLFRSSYAYDAKEAAYFQGRFHATRRERGGARLRVRGSNIKIAWGAPSYKLVDPKEPFGEYTWAWGSEEALVSGNEVETREISLDTLRGLEYGMLYTVYGSDVRYAAEEAR
jgi:hypothetical protein